MCWLLTRVGVEIRLGEKNCEESLVVMMEEEMKTAMSRSRDHTSRLGHVRLPFVTPSSSHGPSCDFF